MFPNGTQNHRCLPPFLRSEPHPIADVRPGKYSPEEARLRCQLASLYRLVDLFQWSQGIYNHMTVRLPNRENEFLINPFGLLYHEITASNLLKVNLNGEVLDGGTTDMGINQAGFTLHSAIHAGREDLQCVIHLHLPPVVAVSVMKCGLLPLCQEAMIVGEVAYHDYQGILTDLHERESLVRDMGSHNVMILRNHGFVAGGRTIEEAFHYVYHLILACETQARVFTASLTEQIVMPSEEAARKAKATASSGGGGVNLKEGAIDRKWGVGELEWEAWMRQLDEMGHRTGYEHRIRRMLCKGDDH